MALCCVKVKPTCGDKCVMWFLSWRNIWNDPGIQYPVIRFYPLNAAARNTGL